MHSAINILSKLVLLALLVIAGLGIWLLPKTRLVSGRHIGERLFVVTYVIGAFCAAAGLAALFAWPGRVRDWHLWEFSLAPLVLLYAYWLAVMRKARTSQVVDEKQDADMAKAGALAWGLSVPAMLLAFQLSQAGLFNPAMWFPYYLLVTLFFHSLGTLYYFNRQ
jgi:hypothetical protein